MAGEFFGTFILILFGDGVVAMVVLFGLGSYETITWGWGLAVIFGIYVSAKISGAHLNPAVTLALALKRNFPWKKVIPYSVAQIAGAFMGAALLYFNYHEAFAHFESSSSIVRGNLESLKTAGIFATYPATFVSNFGAFVDQVVGTSLLVILIFAVTDERNQSNEINRAPFIIGLTVVAIGMSFGGNAGYAINPARDFGPRLLSYFAGWGQLVFTAREYYFCIPIVAPLLGGLAGAFLYDFFVGRFLE
ncbi:MAG: MIP family channel protein [Leptospira sp.]|nr:MIP family channel protein [Leptospira sp.]